jgi:hypothetical protein
MKYLPSQEKCGKLESRQNEVEEYLKKTHSELHRRNVNGLHTEAIKT